MVILLLLLGFTAVGAGMFGLGLGVPVRETAFGAAMLVAASVAITGGFILVGLAAAVSELRRALQHLRVPDRRDAERGRRTEPRIDRPVAQVPVESRPDAHVIPTRFDAPEPEARRPPALEAAAAEMLDTIRPSDYRKPGTEASGQDIGQDTGQAAEQGADVPAAAAAAADDEMKSPPLSPAEAAASAQAAVRPPSRVLKSGTVNDIAYTLFSDGSIETPTPEGTLRFASIDDFRQHLEKSAG
jgi:hypothetical protein